MELNLDNRVLSGKIIPKPVHDDLIRYLVCAGLSSKETIINNVLMNSEAKQVVDIFSSLGADIEIIPYEGIRKTLIVKSPIDIEGNKVDIDLSGNVALLRYISPILVLTKGDICFKYGEYEVKNPLIANYNLFFKHGFTQHQKDRNEYPVRIRASLDEYTFSIRNDVSKEYLSALMIVLAHVYKDVKVRIVGDLLYTHYIRRTIEIMKKFGIEVTNNGFQEFRITRGEERDVEVKVENDYKIAAVWLTSGALGHKVMVKNLNIKSRQNDRKLLDIFKVIGIEVMANRKGDIIARPKKVRAFNIDITQVPDLLPYLAMIAAVADGTSRFKNATSIITRNIKVANELVNVITSIGGDSFILGDDLIVKGRDILRGGEVKNVHLHEVVFALCAASRQTLSPVKIEVPNVIPAYYIEFYRDLERLGGSSLEK